MARVAYALNFWLLSQQVSGGKLHELRTESQGCKNCYITHKACPSNEGIGSLTMRLHPLLNIAERFNLTYVCQEDDFKTGGHATGNMGYLFGCDGQGKSVGDNIANFNHLPKGLTWKTAHILNPKDKLHSHLDIPLEDNTIFFLHEDCYVDPKTHFPMEAFGESYKWFRSQYAQVRNLDASRRNPSCWDGANGKKKIALHVRRGDGGGRGYAVEFYKKTLDAIFQCKTKMKELCIKEKDAHVVVMAETDPNDPEMKHFKDTQEAMVSLLLGKPETDADRSRERLVRDLDCMSVADVLITSGGGFSALASAVLHDEGRSLTLNADAYRQDMPNAVKKGQIGLIALHNENAKSRHSSKSLLVEPSGIPNALQISFDTES
eukprot:gb/GFBE01029014.1/.p1 GENE.gb/GFBE01029014.1/~~gb/GFBE01029014.1/.p1  ORF type:complete len:377 (+),score=83.41 gb/GFBE01029014.1/:1-1131(+)